MQAWWNFIAASGSKLNETFSPNICHGGVKTNVIPDVVDIEVDIRTIPGDNEDEVRRHLDKALGDLAEEVHVDKLFSKARMAVGVGRKADEVYITRQKPSEESLAERGAGSGQELAHVR